MLTLKDINEASFFKAGRSGYKRSDVDEFIDEVVITVKHLIKEKDEALEQLEKEREASEKTLEELEEKNDELEDKNGDLQKKLAVLAERIETYRGEEDGIKDIVLSAHKMAKSAVREAEMRAEEITKEASKNAEEMTKEANNHAERVLTDAKIEANELLSGARDESARKAKLYAEQVVSKKNELEQLKKQISAFRASLMEMYKKHLEMISHIPNFRLRDEDEVSAESLADEKVEVVSNYGIEEEDIIEEAYGNIPKRRSQGNSQIEDDIRYSQEYDPPLAAT